MMTHVVEILCVYLIFAFDIWYGALVKIETYSDAKMRTVLNLRR